MDLITLLLIPSSLHRDTRVPLQELIYKYWLYKKPELKHTAWAKQLIKKQKHTRAPKLIPDPMPATNQRLTEIYLIRSPPKFKIVG
jgi:hypothetical protein